jgi:hypothetical protein
VLPDSARELKARLSRLLSEAPPGSVTTSAVDGGELAGDGAARWSGVALGLTPVGPRSVHLAIRLVDRADADVVLSGLGEAARAEVDVRVIGRVTALSSPTLDQLQQRVRPLRPGLSVGHPDVTAGTLGGFVRIAGGRAVLSNNHVLAASDAATPGDAVLQPGPADDGVRDDRVATLTAFQAFAEGRPNLVDAAVALLDPGVDADPGDLPGGPLGAPVVATADIDPDEAVEKVGRTTGHTRGVVTAVEVDAVAVQYDALVHRFDDQIEIQGVGGFSAGGDSGSVIWRSRDRAPLALLFAGSTTGGVDGSGVTFANPLATVLRLLGAEWLSG